AGILHREVKPSNVLLADGPATAGPSAHRRASPGGAAEISVKLVDFGLALVTEEETLTAAGDVPGTLAYISPERLGGKPAEPATDVWSVGVMLWEALAHRHPFGGGRFLEVAKKIGRGAPSLATVRPDLPRPLVELVDRALSVDPAKRPAAARLAVELRRSLDGTERHRVGSGLSLTLRPAAATRLTRVAPALPAALLAGWSSATLPFFPAHWSAGLALLAAL